MTELNATPVKQIRNDCRRGHKRGENYGVNPREGGEGLLVQPGGQPQDEGYETRRVQGEGEQRVVLQKPLDES